MIVTKYIKSEKILQAILYYLLHFKYYWTQKNREETNVTNAVSFVLIKVIDTEALKNITITYPNAVGLNLEHPVNIK